LKITHIYIGYYWVSWFRCWTGSVLELALRTKM